MNFGKSSLLFFSLLILLSFVSVALSEETPPLRLTVTTDKAAYTRTESVHLTVTLENVSGSPVTICADPKGTIHVESYSVDGEPISRELDEPLTERNIVLDWYYGIRTLKPGEKIETKDAAASDLVGDKGPSMEDIIVETVEEDGERVINSNVYSYYPQKGAGSYALKLYYLFTGPPKDENSSIPYRGKVLSNEVTFVVQ